MPQPQERREQISVPVDPDLRAKIERAAEVEHRTVAGQIRHWIIAALATGSPAARAPR